MPPLQDITHKFVSPLPPSSSPALSYIDEDEDKIHPSSTFLVFKTSPARLIAPEPEFESNDHNHPPSGSASNFVFLTPKSKLAEGSAEGSDPFGFLAAERKLKLARGKSVAKAKHADDTRRKPLDPLEPQRKRQKLDASTTPKPPPTENTPFKRPNTSQTQTQTPISKRTADIRTLTPPALTPLHKRKRRRATKSFDDEENNPFLVAGSPPVLSSPSPVKSRARRRSDDGDDAFYNDENVNPFFTAVPTLAGEGQGTSNVPSIVSSTVASPIRRRRKRDKLVVEEVGDETFSALADDPAVLAMALRARLPKRKTREELEDGNDGDDVLVTPVKKKAKTKVTEGGQRRSARLSARASKPTRASVGTKKKGKENASKTSAALPKKTSASTKSKGKAKADDVVIETWEKERTARLDYFKKLESYELETENIYVV